MGRGPRGAVEYRQFRWHAAVRSGVPHNAGFASAYPRLVRLPASNRRDTCARRWHMEACQTRTLRGEHRPPRRHRSGYWRRPSNFGAIADTTLDAAVTARAVDGTQWRSRRRGGTDPTVSDCRRPRCPCNRWFTWLPQSSARSGGDAAAARNREAGYDRTGYNKSASAVETIVIAKNDSNNNELSLASPRLDAIIAPAPVAVAMTFVAVRRSGKHAIPGSSTLLVTQFLPTHLGSYS